MELIEFEHPDPQDIQRRLNSGEGFTYEDRISLLYQCWFVMTQVARSYAMGVDYVDVNGERYDIEYAISRNVATVGLLMGDAQLMELGGWVRREEDDEPWKE